MTDPAAGGAWLALASRSPRRLALLREAGYDPDVIDAGVDDGELVCASLNPMGVALALAHFKAAAAASRPEARGRVVLAADTFVVKGGAIIGKPADEADADRIIRRLSGGSHVVVTGVCLIDRRAGAAAWNRVFLVDRARVTVGEISDEARSAYLASGGWRGKAGAYNLAERLAEGWPIVVAGDSTTVMGLPMRRLASILARCRPDAEPGTAPEPRTP